MASNTETRDDNADPLRAPTQNEQGSPMKKYQPSIDSSGAFARPDSKHRLRVGTEDLPVESKRYIIYIALACPWASRCTAVIDIMGLEDEIEIVSVAAEMQKTKPDDPTDTHVGWVFPTEKKGRYVRPDPIFGARTLRDIYEQCGDYQGKFTTPLLVDKTTKRIVNNESSDIIRMLNMEFSSLARHPFDIYPIDLRPTIDEVNNWVYHNINNGVYRAGFAQSQKAYDDAVNGLFEHLEKAELILSKMRYMCSDKTLTEADIRLFETLVRFDHVYHTHFKCNVKRIKDYPNLTNFTREIYQLVPMTVDIDEIKRHYYTSHVGINPYKIIAKGPEVDFNLPHDRDSKFPFEIKVGS
jgi:putative glutathione S-transferase